MSKEEILKKAKEWLSQRTETIPIDNLHNPDIGEYFGINETTLYELMTQFADQEKEKVALSFADWKDKMTKYDNGFYFLFDTEKWFKLPYLYEYFISNVYNK